MLLRELDEYKYLAKVNVGVRLLKNHIKYCKSFKKIAYCETGKFMDQVESLISDCSACWAERGILGIWHAFGEN